MIYKFRGKPVDMARAKRVVAAVQATLDGFADESEAESLWELAHDQSTQGYCARDLIEANSSLTMRHSNEEQ